MESFSRNYCISNKQASLDVIIYWYKGSDFHKKQWIDGHAELEALESHEVEGIWQKSAEYGLASI